MLRPLLAALATAALLAVAATSASAATHYCPDVLLEHSVVAGRCPDNEILSTAAWVAGGQKTGVSFVVWGSVHAVEHGTATVWCPRYNSIALAGHHWGVRSTVHLSGLTAKEVRDPRGARGLYVSWHSASPSGGYYQSWIVCRGHASTFIDPRT